jgi:O-antigen/teichoic acid export membrane protein
VSAEPSPADTVASRDVAGPARVDISTVASRSAMVSASRGLVGVLAYSGTLILAHLLAPPAYSVYVAAATLLGIVGTFAAALVPMPLINVVRSHPRRSEPRRRALAFGLLVSVVAGLLAAVVMGTVAATFAPPYVVIAVAVSALTLFGCSPVWAWLHGELWFTRSAAMTIAEVGSRVLFSTGAVLLGWGAGGALIGFVAGVLVVLLLAPRAMRGDLAWRPGVLRERGRWTETGEVAFTQLTASTLVGADVVLIAMLGAPAVESAGYQALSTLAKGPVYVAAGAAVVAFPLLRGENARVGEFVAAALRSFSLLAFPAAVVVATAPPEVVLLVLPDRYADSIRLLPELAAAGLGYAGLITFTTLMLGLRAYRRCQLGLLLAAILFAAGATLGWELGAVSGLAVGVAIGALAGAGGMWLVASPLLPDGTLRRALVGLALTAVLLGLLGVAHVVPVLWTVCVGVLGVVVVGRVRQRAHPSAPTWPRRRRRSGGGDAGEGAW